MPVDRVTLVEVGPRDGLQNEKQPIDTALKIELIERLQASGLQHIEATSFVSPRWVPQMADAAQVMAGVTRLPGVTYSVLTPNAKGLEGALAARADEVLVFAAASEAFSQRNLNCSIDESLARFEPVVQGAKAAGLRVRGAISCAVGCPYQGDVSPDEVERVVKAYRALGVDQVSMADTIGVGTPRQVQAALERVLRHYPLHEVCGHYHDTYGQALAIEGYGPGFFRVGTHVLRGSVLVTPWDAGPWGGMVDCTPDAIPVIGPVLSRPGVYISAGHTGHGFGIGPAAGRLAADLIRGDTPSVDPRPFRYERMIDGSDLGSMGMM